MDSATLNLKNLANTYWDWDLNGKLSNITGVSRWTLPCWRQIGHWGHLPTTLLWVVPIREGTILLRNCSQLFNCNVRWCQICNPLFMTPARPLSLLPSILFCWSEGWEEHILGVCLPESTVMWKKSQWEGVMNNKKRLLCACDCFDLCACACDDVKCGERERDVRNPWGFPPSYLRVWVRLSVRE